MTVYELRKEINSNESAMPYLFSLTTLNYWLDWIECCNINSSIPDVKTFMLWVEDKENIVGSHLSDIGLPWENDDDAAE